MDLKYEEAEHFFSILVKGRHHIGEIREFGCGWYATISDSLTATFDSGLLTNLVFLAHDMCIRAEVMGGGPHRIKVAIFKRERDGMIYKRHPTLEQAVAAWRALFPEGWYDNSEKEPRPVNAFGAKGQK